METNFLLLKSEKEKDLRVDYIGKNNEGNIYFAFSDIVIYYDYKEKKAERVDLPIQGPIVYCSDRIAIQSNVTQRINENYFSLKLYKFTKKALEASGWEQYK